MRVPEYGEVRKEEDGHVSSLDLLFESIEGGISRKKLFSSKAKRLYSIFASVFFMLAVFVVPAFAADGDPLAVVNNLSDFIFSLIRSVGLSRP